MDDGRAITIRIKIKERDRNRFNHHNHHHHHHHPLQSRRRRQQQQPHQLIFYHYDHPSRIYSSIQMRPDTPRPLVAGPDDGPAPPFPITLFGPVIKGFGRGSKEVRAGRHWSSTCTCLCAPVPVLCARTGLFHIANILSSFCM